MQNYAPVASVAQPYVKKKESCVFIYCKKSKLTKLRRFLKESNREIVKNSFIPFGGGIRICPGRHMAMVVLKTLLILLYRKYDVELVDKVSKKPKFKYSVTNSCTDMKVIVRPKKEY